MSTKLDDAVRTALNSHKGDWQSIATAAEVSHSWLSKFARGKINNPGYGTLLKLESALVAKSKAKRQAAARG